MGMDISQFKPAIVYTIYIVATPEQVWQALTSAEFTRRYFFGNAVGRSEGRRCVHRAHAGWGAAHLWRGDRMRSTEKAHVHVQRQLAGADRKARAHARHLRDRGSR